MTMKTSVLALTLICLGALAGCQHGIEPEVMAPAVDPNAVNADKNAQPAGCVETITNAEEGIASWYGKSRNGKKTASGEKNDMNAATAAHRTLPLGSRVKVTNLANGHTTTLTINDRGPFKTGRIIDVSLKGAKELGFVQDGLAQVRVETTDAKGPSC